MSKRYLFYFLLVVLLGHFTFRVFEYHEEYFVNFDEKYWEDRYLRSQWFAPIGCGDYNPHINPETCVWDDAWYQSEGQFKQTKKFEPIGDDGLYAYAGWEYINGRDPTTLNAEIPPLGKYLIGTSIILFDNQNIFALLTGIGAIIALYLLSREIFRNNILAAIPPLLFSLEPLFYTQLRAPFLDLLYLLFGVLTFYFILRKSFFLSAVFFGGMIATKASIATFGIILITVLIYFFLTRQYSSAKKYLFFMPISIIVFLLSYIQFFLMGNSPIEFLRVQKWIINFYATGTRGSATALWEMMFTGQWTTWWQKVEIVNEWSITWVLLAGIAIIGIFIALKNQEKGAILLIMVWTVIYMLFLTFVPLFPRYLLLLLPFFIIIVVWVIANGYKRIVYKRR